MYANSCLFLGPLVESRLVSFLVSQCNVRLSFLFAHFSLCMYSIVWGFFNKSGGVLGISAATAGLELKVK